MKKKNITKEKAEESTKGGACILLSPKKACRCFLFLSPPLPSIKGCQRWLQTKSGSWAICGAGLEKTMDMPPCLHDEQSVQKGPVQLNLSKRLDNSELSVFPSAVHHDPRNKLVSTSSLH